MADNRNTSLAASSKGTPLAAAGRGSVEEEVDTCTPEEAGSRCSREAAGRGSVEVTEAHSIPLAEAGRSLFEVAADRSILGLEDSKRPVFRLVDACIWDRTLPSEAPRMVNNRFER